MLEDVSSQAAQNIEVLYVSGMYVACAVSLFVSYVEQIPEKKIFLSNNFLDLVLFIWSLKI